MLAETVQRLEILQRDAQVFLWFMQGQPTYTPRLVLFDLSGSLGGDFEAQLLHKLTSPFVQTGLWPLVAGSLVHPATVHRSEPEQLGGVE